MVKKSKRELCVDSFNLPPGRIFARKYEIADKLGAGWKGEVYKIRGRSTEKKRKEKGSNLPKRGQIFP
jgi:hypothetical protein